MKTVGFPISQKENEKRRCLIPQDIDYIKHKDVLYIERGYGEVLGYPDKSYQDKGINVVERNEVLKQDIICDPKIGDAEYLSLLKKQTLFGWIHAVQNREITDVLVNNQLTAYAWEDMFDRGRHVFWRNNEIAGEAAVMHAYTLHGLFPYNTKVAILGKGNISRGALKILTCLGADVDVYDRKTEKFFKDELSQYDVVVNAILWDTRRNDHIIYKDDLKKMKHGALIIDISCDRNGGIETSIPTTINSPIYVVDGITHYVVDHTPTLFYKTISVTLSSIVSAHIDMLIEEKINKTLKDALIIQEGLILDDRIVDYQKR